MNHTVHLTGIGPQYSGDGRFQARMRFHQSWYRSTVLGVPCGTGPNASSDSHYGNILREVDGDRGLNFTSPEAFMAARRRVDEGSGTVEPFRLFHNMLSSMPMCFNLFGPFVDDADLATVALRSLLGDNEVKCVQETVLEFAPSPRSEYLNDRTAFDAFVTYERPDGSLGFLGIETKLTESFSKQHYDSPAYRRWVEQSDSPWPEESWSRLDDVKHNQLWRGHLLATAMTSHPRSLYAAGRFALIRHPGDTECARVVEGYSRLLKPQDVSFLDLPLDRLISVWEQTLPQCCTDWLARFRLRYLDLGASESEWRLHCRGQ
ncbi:MAG: PGN_0703 family putative restriction endonuclease [Armatimonadota bacterium]